MYILKLSPAMANEWMVRCIGDVIPALGDRTFEPGHQVSVNRATLGEIEADCRFMLDPNGPDLTTAERRAYRDMLAQCRLAATLGPAL